MADFGRIAPSAGIAATADVPPPESDVIPRLNPADLPQPQSLDHPGDHPMSRTSARIIAELGRVAESRRADDQSYELEVALKALRLIVAGGDPVRITAGVVGLIDPERYPQFEGEAADLAVILFAPPPEARAGGEPVDKPRNYAPPNCAVCGRFVDCKPESQSRFDFTPDSYFTVEKAEWICPRCAAKSAPPGVAGEQSHP